MLLARGINFGTGHRPAIMFGSRLDKHICQVMWRGLLRRGLGGVALGLLVAGRSAGCGDQRHPEFRNHLNSSSNGRSAASAHRRRSHP